MPSAPTLTIVILITAIGAAFLSLQWTTLSQQHIPLALQWTNLAQSAQTCPTTEQEPKHSGYFEYECAGKPHHASWDSWWHPQRRSSEQGAGALTKDWNILYHLGGNGPWVEKVHNVVEGGVAVPEECRVEQVHMMSRHAERYPTLKAGTRGFNLLIGLDGLSNLLRSNAYKLWKE